MTIAGHTVPHAYCKQEVLAELETNKYICNARNAGLKILIIWE